MEDDRLISRWVADSSLADVVVPSPNFGERRGCSQPNMLLLHYTATPTGAYAMHLLTSPEAEVSAHYLIDIDGGISQLVPEAKRAWHAGVSSWHGEQDINSCSIGIEIQNPATQESLGAFPDEQMERVVALCVDIVSRHDIPAARVLAHSDVAPSRKQDPGAGFDWALLHANGVGLVIDELDDSSDAQSGQFPHLVRGDEGDSVSQFQAELLSFGYGIEVTGVFDEATETVVKAFQSHWRQCCIDGVADFSTRSVLYRLQALNACA